MRNYLGTVPQYGPERKARHEAGVRAGGKKSGRVRGGEDPKSPENLPDTSKGHDGEAAEVCECTDVDLTPWLTADRAVAEPFELSKDDLDLDAWLESLKSRFVDE